MRAFTPIRILLHCSASILAVQASVDHAASGSLVVPRNAQNVSTCVTQCFLQIFPHFDCPDLEICICANTELQNAVAKCAFQQNCSTQELLAAKKAQAKTCGLPIRNKAITLVLTDTILLVLATTCAIFRALGRRPFFGGAGYGWDDYVLFACCLPMIGVTVVAYMEQQYGLGQDTWELTIDNIEKCLLLFYIGANLYTPVIYGTKVAFVLLYIRIWRDNITFRRICQAIIVALLCALIAFQLSTVFLCTPIEYTWDAIRKKPGHCLDREAQIYTNTSVNIAFDFVVLLLPLPKLLTLNMSMTKKIGLLLTFIIGFAVTAVSIIQLYYLVTRLPKTSNPTWDYFDIAFWRTIEMYLCIICCCAPMMAGLGMRSWKRVTSWTSLPNSISALWAKSFGSSSSRSRNKSTRDSEGTISKGVKADATGQWRQLHTPETELDEMHLRRETNASLGTSKGYLQIGDRRREIAAAKAQENAVLDQWSFASEDHHPEPVARPCHIYTCVQDDTIDKALFRSHSPDRPALSLFRDQHRTSIRNSPSQPVSPLGSPGDIYPTYGYIEPAREIVSARSWSPPLSASRRSDESDTLPPHSHDPAQFVDRAVSLIVHSPRPSMFSRHQSHPLRSNGLSDSHETGARLDMGERDSHHEQDVSPTSPDVPPKARERSWPIR